MSESEAWRTIRGIAAGIDRIDAHLSQVEAKVSEFAAVVSRLEKPGVTDAPVIAEVVALHRDHPQWAVWLPVPGGEWAALRPAGSQPPNPEIPMIWVRASTADGLAERMRGVDAHLTASAGGLGGVSG